MASGGGSREPGEDPLEALVHAGLRSIRDSLRLDLAAYLYESDAAGRRLFLAAAVPDVDALDLLQRMGALIDGGRDGLTTIGPVHCLTVMTSGRASRGLFAFGGPDADLSADEQVIVIGTARAMGASCHALEGSGHLAAGRAPVLQQGDHAARVVVEVQEGQARADVWLAGPSGERKGSSSGVSTLDAVAAATLDALQAPMRVREVGERYVGGSPVVVVVLERPAAGLSAGAAARGTDPLHATAAATLAAAHRT